MANYYFRLRDTNATKPTPIALFAQINGNRIKCKTNECILPEQWDNETKLPKRKKETKVLTDRLTFLQSVANDTYLYFRDVLKVSEPTTNDFQVKFYELSGIDTEPKTETTPATKKLTLFEFIDKFIAEAAHRQNEHTGETIAHNTIKVYNQCERLLKEYSDKKYKLDFNRLQLDTLLDFKEFLHSKQFGPNTIAKHIITLKTFLNEAYERGYTDSIAHKSKRFRAVQVKTDTIYLTENELDEVYKLDLSKTPHLDRVRDLFLVGCYTGLRFSDFTNIQPENIDGGFIEIKSEKTKIDTVIPIHPVVNEIMNKYEGKHVNSLPPAISNQKFNEYIKEVCAMCETLQLPVKQAAPKTKTRGPQIHKGVPKYKLVSSHTARRSFATNQYNRGISANILMKITGHKTEKSFYTYIRVTPKENAQRLRELWQRDYSHLKVV
jgi:integrase